MATKASVQSPPLQAPIKYSLPTVTQTLRTYNCDHSPHESPPWLYMFVCPIELRFAHLNEFDLKHGIWENIGKRRLIMNSRSRYLEANQ